MTTLIFSLLIGAAANPTFIVLSAPWLSTYFCCRRHSAILFSLLIGAADPKFSSSSTMFFCFILLVRGVVSLKTFMVFPELGMLTSFFTQCNF